MNIQQPNHNCVIIDHIAYVNRDTAALLKAAGFEWTTELCYYMTDIPTPTKMVSNWSDGSLYCPNLDEAQRFLREKYRLHITIYSQSQQSWQYRVTSPGQTLEDGLFGEDFYTFEEAQAAAIFDTLMEVVLPESDLDYCGPMKDMEYKVPPVVEDGRWYEVLNKGRYKGYEYCIVSYGSYPCAYIGVPNGHKLDGMSYDDFYKTYGWDACPVNGGFTYSNNSGWFLGAKWTFGWDYGHYGDYVCFASLDGEPCMRDPMDRMWSTEDVLDEVHSAIDDIVELLKEEKC